VNEPKQILVIEDEVKIARFLELELSHEGYGVQVCHDGRAGLEAFESGSFHLILLDIMLPEISGIEVCRRIRKNSDIPIIMLTAKDSTSDKVLGLNIGADDYLAKPFEIEELLARIRVVLRRTRPEEERDRDICRVADLELDEDTKTVTREGRSLSLTRREFELLSYLMHNRDIVLSRETLLQQVWGWNYFGDTNTVDVYIRYLRNKVDVPFSRPLIRTVRGFGYMLKDGDV